MTEPSNTAQAKGSDSPSGMGWTGNLRALGIATSLLLLIALFTVLASLRGIDFLALRNVQTMAGQSVIISLGALGMTLIIISGGIDLSVGSVIALSMVVTSWCLEIAGFSLAVSALAGILTGGLAGLANGAMITGFRIVPFVATLGMMGMARGLAKLISKSQQINIDHEGWEQSWLALLTWNPHLFDWVDFANVFDFLNLVENHSHPLPPAGTPYLPGWLVVAPSVWLLLFLAIIMALVLARSVFGRHVFAIGSNEAAARLCGVPVSRVKLLIYALSGLFTGLAGVVFCSRQSQGDPTAAMAYELDVIAAVVIGGGSLRGGEGSIFGSLAGALIMIVLRTGLRMVNAPAPVQEILIGAIIIIAVVVDQLQHRKGD